MPTQSVSGVAAWMMSDADSPALLHMINTRIQTCCLPNWQGQIHTNACTQTKMQSRTAGLSLDTCFPVTPNATQAHICPANSHRAAVHKRLIVSVTALTFWPQLYVKEGGLQVDYLTATMEHTATLLACLCRAKSSLRYYSQPMQVCAWNICFYLLRLGGLPITSTGANICLYLSYIQMYYFHVPL